MRNRRITKKTKEQKRIESAHGYKKKIIDKFKIDVNSQIPHE